ncbi:hypothetical protein [Paraburkholderia fungorum]|uniref:hypothetical protein n=1 Tax=Paraburkholderia fungorum TaxID=134537 RepID=UPI0038BB1C47
MAECEAVAQGELGVTPGSMANARASAGRPAPGLRVGVTGHRTFPAADLALLDQAVGKILDTIGATMHGLASDGTLHPLYADDKPVLRVISPLAAGADRVVARQAVARQWLLSASLPFPQHEYEKDFADSVDEFRSLLACAKAIDEVVELDGRREVEGAAYFEAGHFVLRHSDVLIAIWDGLEAAGEGGTGEIVETALRLGLPVVHIHSVAPHAVKLRLDPSCGEAEDSLTLEALVRQIVLPAWRTGSTNPTSTRHHPRAVAEYVDEPESAYADQMELSWSGLKPRLVAWLGGVFPRLQRWLGGASPVNASELKQPASAGSQAAVTYVAHFQRADALATHYANIHRSAFVLIYILGSISLFAAFMALSIRGVKFDQPELDALATGAELAALGCVALLVVADSRCRWRERWLDYRTLAEHFRQADLLATLGGSEPCGCMNRNSEIHPMRGWVPWFAAAVTRSVGIVGARYDAAYLSEIRDWAVKQRLSDQLAYNEATVRRNATISKRLRRFSVRVFKLTMAAVVIEIVLHLLPIAWVVWVESVFLADCPVWLASLSPGAFLGFFAGALPALGAASFGIRNQAEFEIVVHRSARLIGLLAVEKANIERLTGDRLTSKSLRLAVQKSANIMQDDSRAWAEIFEVKESEVV